ncbi:uncharacterized protein LOC120692501 isoform X1 [Panicum virgatum]|uniref:Uncharacterized protein n=1 Tax=Panicum virgatum TaxID=38727 RepID=A0A8T0MEK2_PANVG|nr:uncharacterized protein LOC120692501 isoform X1 [Panicum virgatum]KAG2535761.1 hypothetical protein PVAP13_9NG136946 [Panicum virgatum]
MAFPAGILPFIATGRRISCSFFAIHLTSIVFLRHPLCPGQIWYFVFVAGTDCPRRRGNQCDSVSCSRSGEFQPMLGLLPPRKLFLIVVVWCADPDLIPNEAIVRIPERVDTLANNNLFLRPEEIIHHELPLLHYKVEIEILEVQDWDDNGSSGGSGTLPSDEDYPGFHQSSRSGPWPRRTVFRTPGFGNSSNASAGTGGPNSSTPAVDCAQVCASVPPAAPLWRFGRGLPATSCNRLPSPPPPPLRFGSFPPVHLEPSTRSGPCSLVDSANLQAVNRDAARVAVDFDPMIDEASGFLGRWLSRADLGNEVFHESVSPLTDTQFDPMCLEAGILPDQPSSVRCNDDAAAIDTTLADLESIRFDVPEMAQVVCSSPAVSNNVTVARGTKETLPFHLFADNHVPVTEHVVNFAHSVCREAPLPVLNTSPPRRRSRQPQETVAIRRSERLAKKSRHRATKPAVQAQNVMMKKMGITSDSRPPDASSFQQFTDTFSSMLTKLHCEALDALLPAGMGALAVEPAAPVMVS